MRRRRVGHVRLVLLLGAVPGAVLPDHRDALGLRDAQLIYTNSSDLEAWAEPQLAYNRTLTFRGGGAAARTAHVARLERPQLIFADGPDAAPSHGLFGLMERKQGTCRNVAVAFGRAA